MSPPPRQSAGGTPSGTSAGTPAPSDGDILPILARLAKEIQDRAEAPDPDDVDPPSSNFSGIAMPDVVRQRISTGSFVSFDRIIGRPVADYADWAEAFFAYMAVVLEKEPQRGRELCGYASLIRRAEQLNHARGQVAGWMAYDAAFRRLRARSPAGPWAELDPTLFHLEVLGALQRASPVSSGSLGPRDPPAGSSRPLPCYAYNSSLGCSRGIECGFAHVCQGCGGSGHGRSNCPPRPNKKRRGE
jgi:hypothetical protein